MNGKVGQVKLLPLNSIRLSPENGKVYRPVDPDDPDIQALADSIRECGLQEPLAVTADRYVISGHRRLVACRIAGLERVRCVVRPFRKDDDHDHFMRLLTTCNRQRVKSLDEIVKEEVLTAESQGAYQSLLEHRRAASIVQAKPMVLAERRERRTISGAKRPMLEAVQFVLAAERSFWPLSVRAIHYRLLNRPPLIHASKPQSVYCNDRRSYQALDELLTRARLEKIIPFEAIDDPTRPTVLWDVHPDPAAFIRRELDDFCMNYARDLMRSQPNHVEVVVEKNSILPIIRPVVAEYAIPMTSGRGYCSLPPRWEMAQRYRASGKTKLVILLLSDLDPDGEVISECFARSMRDDFGIEGACPVHVALRPEHVQRFKLPPTMEAKRSSAHYDTFTGRHGNNRAYELEAMRPEDLQAVLREAIEGVVDRRALDAEMERERQDAGELVAYRRRVRAALGDGRARP